MGSAGLYRYVGPSVWSPHILVGGPQHTMPRTRGARARRAVRQCRGNCANNHPHSMARNDAASKGTERAGGCHKTKRDTFQSAHPAMD